MRLPELGGLEVLERVRHRPLVVFTTAYDRYAVAAFKLEAVDYLVKPFGRERFLRTLQRVRRRLDGAGTEDLPPAAARLREGMSRLPLRRLFARKGSRIVPVDLTGVDHLRASGDYVEIRAADESFLVQLSLSELQRRLDSSRFLRIHRSHVVNLDLVRSIERYDDRRLVVVLRSGRRVVASRSGSRRLRALVP